MNLTIYRAFGYSDSISFPDQSNVPSISLVDEYAFKAWAPLYIIWLDAEARCYPKKRWIGFDFKSRQTFEPLEPLENKWDLGQKVKFLHFLIWNDKSTGGKFFYTWKVVWKLKSIKSREKFFFVCSRFYTRNATNKSCLFYAEFFEFEVKTYSPFLGGSI